MPHQYTTKNIARFNSKVKVMPNGCWEWQASCFKNGYGRIRVGEKTTGAHRVSYEIHVGNIPDGMCVCHTCDNPRCCNPSHLWLGTIADNAKDREAKGRRKMLRGEQSKSAKLTEDDIRNIKRLREKGWKQRPIAVMFGISEQQVSRICSGKSWAHVT